MSCRIFRSRSGIKQSAQNYRADCLMHISSVSESHINVNWAYSLHANGGRGVRRWKSWRRNIKRVSSSPHNTKNSGFFSCRLCLNRKSTEYLNAFSMLRCVSVATHIPPPPSPPPSPPHFEYHHYHPLKSPQTLSFCFDLSLHIGRWEEKTFTHKCCI